RCGRDVFALHRCAQTDGPSSSGQASPRGPLRRASRTSFTIFRSRLVHLTCERPWPGQVAPFPPPLWLLSRICVRIGGVGKAADLSSPVRRDEWRLGGDLPAQLLVRFVHEFRVKRAFIILGGERLGDTVAILQPFRDASVFLAPQPRKGVAVRWLVEIIVKMGLLKEQGPAE